MEKFIEICEIAGFKITETRRLGSGGLVRTIFHIRNSNGKIVSSDYSNPVEPSNLLAMIRDSDTATDP